MLADPAFRGRVCQAVHAFRHDVSVEARGAGMSVVVDQTQPARGIPPFAKMFVGEDIRIVQREDWGDQTGATVALDIPGKPGRFDGVMSLAPDQGGDGSVETVSGDVTVKVPMIGARLEGLVSDLLHSALEHEEAVGRAWLAGEH